MMAKRKEDALMKLKAYVEQKEMSLGVRFLPERMLCVELDVSRSALREAFETMEANGEIWRRVGKGTFLGGRPIDEDTSVFQLSSMTSPVEIMEARLFWSPSSLILLQ